MLSTSLSNSSISEKVLVGIMSNSGSKTFEIGTVLNDKWVILEFIGRGGMGEVYRAHQLNLKRDVAIKVISKEWVRSLEGDAHEASACLERFRREVEMMAQIRHPNVIQIFDYGFVEDTQADGETSVQYMVMEYIPGSTLRSTMSDEGFYPEEDRTREWLIGWLLPKKTDPHLDDYILTIFKPPGCPA